MGGRWRFYLRFAARRGNGSAGVIEQADSEVFVEAQPAGKFFLERFGNALGHGGIKRRSASARLLRARRFADARPQPKSDGPLRSCSFSEAQGRVRREKRASQYWCPGQN